ncbi:MAG: protein kinase domain-containing protein [Gemmatimonadales bacterium]
MIHCPACRAELPGESQFCSLCGAVVATVAVTDPPVARARPSDLERRLTAAVSGRYLVKRLLGQGGMGAVFLADDLELDRPVAIKVLPNADPADPSFVERFRREARTAAKLDHPNIIPIYRVESAGDLHYFVMRYVPGKTLDEVLADQPRLDPDQARAILVQAALALGHAHQAGIVHRDVKPANIMLDAEGRVILTDFGISKAVQATTHLTNTGMIVGTPTYMAPEQGRGQTVDGRADQYALGVVAFQILTGTLPFEADDVFTLMFRHMSEPPPSLAERRPGLPADLCAAVERALAKEPGDRFASMEDFAAHLEGATAATVVIGTGQPRTRGGPGRSRARRPRPPATGRRSRVLVGLGAAGLTIAVVALALTARGSQAGLEPEQPVVAPSQTAPAPPPPPPSQPALVSTDSGAPPATVPPPAPPPTAEPIASVSRPQKPTGTQPAASPPPAPIVAKVDRAMVTIGVDGSYATVYIDNELVGETPVVRELTFGDHDIRIEREGFKTIRQRVTVAGPMTRRYTLEPAPTP